LIDAPLSGGLGLAAYNAAGVIRFYTNGTSERMRIDSSGNVGIGTTSPNAAALLDVTSTTKGFLPPRMTTVQRDAITTPPAGLMIYNTTTNKLNFYNGSAWEAVTSI
jgi:preprotein translocase subunit Sec61beta